MGANLDIFFCVFSHPTHRKMTRAQRDGASVESGGVLGYHQWR